VPALFGNGSRVRARVDAASKVLFLWFWRCSTDGLRWIQRWLAAIMQEVRCWFVFGSGLAQAWFMLGSLLVRLWFIVGSLVVHWWFAAASLFLLALFCYCFCDHVLSGLI
jgi:hypothetical protein